MSPGILKSVLIVEDVDEMRGLLEMVISTAAGLKVSGVARNVWEARLELARRKPDLVLLDEILPGESSADLLAEILNVGIPVLMITELADPTHPIPAGAAGRITKPGWDQMDSDRDRMSREIFKVLA